MSPADLSGRPTEGALFAGYGGLGLGLQRVFPTLRPAWFSQYDPQGGKRQAPSRILAHHWPDVPNLGDVTAIDWSQVEPVDVLTGGFPCQDVSPAGKRAGLIRGVTRSGLWGAMATAVEALRPRLVVIENVRGLLSAKADSDVEQCAWCVGGAADGEPTLRALGAVLGDLADLGYDAAWVVLPASGVGAPHRRERCFVLAWPQSEPGALTWPQSEPGALTWPQSEPGALLPTPAVNDMGAAYTPDEWDEWTDRMRAEHGNGNGHGASLSIETLRLLKTPTAQLGVNGGSQHPDKRTAGGHGPTLADQVEHLLPTPKATNNENRSSEWANGPNLGEAIGLLPTPSVADVEGGRKHRSGERSGELLLNGLAAEQRFGQYAAAIARWEVVTRPAPDPTEPTGKGGAHRLSPRFVEWMQGLPDGWVTDVPGITRNDMLKALGNGVVPQQAAEAVRWLLEVRATALRGAVAA